ncbi:MAG: DUF3800 domain-containing protein [Bacteriovoracaceae bacterium]
MHLLYADESGDNGLPKTSRDPFNNSPYFIRVGVILHDKQWHAINSRVLNFRKKYKIPYEVEIHATEVLSGKSQQTIKVKGKKKKIKKKNWFGKNIPKQEDRKSLLAEFLKEVFSLGHLTVIVVIINKKKINLDIREGHMARNPKMKSLELLSERFNLFIKTAKDRNGLMVMDSVGPMDDKLHHSFQKSLYKDSKYIQSYHFIESLLFAPSEQSNFLQVADVCAYAVKRKIVDCEDLLYLNIENYLFKNEGKTKGRGFKEWPK